MNNRKQTKRALLTSVMALVMCVVMLVGTTFAWFTDTASTNVNTIKAGKLKVLLMDEAGNDLEGKTLNFLQMDENSEVKPNDNILWEPGATYQLPKMQIKNDGDLALKYKIDVSGAKVADGAPAKSLDLLNVLEWTYTVGGNDYALNSDKSLGVGKTDTLVIKAHMKETANNDYQGMAIDGIAITVYATQDTVEYDSTTDQYDKYAQYGERTVKSETLVKDASGTYGLPGTNNSSIYNKNETYSIPAGNYDGGFYAQHFGINSTFDGNGSTFKSFQLNCGYVPTTEESTLVVSNVNVEGDMIITASSNNVIIYNCTAKHISVLGIKNDITVTIDGCKVTGTPVDDVVGNNKYDIYITRPVSEGTANVNILNSDISGSKGHAIAVNSAGATCNFNIAGNTFSDYGKAGEQNRAAFKIWGDKVLAPAQSNTMNEAAAALANEIKSNNTFPTPNTNCVVAEFYGATLGF